MEPREDPDDTPGENEDRGGYVGRGGLKLAAGFRLLGGAEKAQGAKALDIGASTGGFTQCLLENGAARVTAIEVGHSQLHETLRADARVENLERINFKTVSLTVAPGPFDFFVIDVSFVAARTMLRPLAFRLRPGAEGFILIKPQFELPDGYVWKGDVRSPGLRTWAVMRVVKKGESMGFRMLSEIDSPVVGGSGTVEILSRWVYDGPTSELARKADVKKAPPPKPRTTPREGQHVRPGGPPRRASGPPTRAGGPPQKPSSPPQRPSGPPQKPSGAPSRPSGPPRSGAPARPEQDARPASPPRPAPAPQPTLSSRFASSSRAELDDREEAAPRQIQPRTERPRHRHAKPKDAAPAEATPKPKGTGGGYADLNRGPRPKPRRRR